MRDERPVDLRLSASTGDFSEHWALAQNTTTQQLAYVR